MAELTEREKKILSFMFVMMNPQMQGVPFSVKDGLIRTMFLMAGRKFDEVEMSDLGEACKAEIKSLMQGGMKFIDKHKDSLKGLSDLG